MDADAARRHREGACGPVFVSAISVDRVTLALGGKTILADISLDIGEGEFVGVLGPNGAGKTTLMRAILGLVRPISGAIRVFDRPAARGNPALGYLPQVRTILPDLRLSGYEFIANSVNGQRFGLPWRGAADLRELDACLAIVGANAIASRPISEMSGGERQRLLFAQALLGKPRILLLDEPLISLDARHQQVVIELAARLCREMKMTILFSAHELNQLLGSIDRVLYLGNGQAALGTTDEVITVPVLSRLYGAPIEVIRTGRHIFVLSEGAAVGMDGHVHEHRHEHA
jgi:zinc/manganese transport system ATP-binding protein